MNVSNRTVADPDVLSHKDNMASMDAVAVSPGSPSLVDPVHSSQPVETSKADMIGSTIRSERGADAMIRDQADSAKLARRRRTIRWIWGTVLGLIAALVIAAYLNRHVIVASQPETAALFEAIGVEVSSNGLKIDPPEARTILVNGTAVIRVESAVRNLTDRTTLVPLIELVLHDTDGRELLRWYVETQPRRIAASGRIVFTSEIMDPPDGVTGLRYRFADSSTDRAQINE